MKHLRESLCDDHVLLAGEDVRDYADTLLTLAARIARPARTASVLGLVGRPSPGLSGRVTHLLEEERDMSIKLTAGARRIVVVTTLGMICGLSLAAVRASDETTATQPDTSATTPAADPFAGNDQAADPLSESGVDADPFLASDAAAVRFSDVREHVLSMGSLKFLLDLDTDQAWAPPARNGPGQEKMDVHPAQEQPYDRPAGLLCDRSIFLVGPPLRGIKVTPGDWNASVSDLRDALASDEVQPLADMEYDAEGAATFFFRTGDGTEGILQLTAIINGSPPFVGRDTQGIRVRYKVLASVAEEDSPAADGPAAPPDALLAAARETASEDAEDQPAAKLLAPQDPIATSGVVPLLMPPLRRLEVFPQSPELELNSIDAPSDAESPPAKESVEWKSFIAVRALFDRAANIRWLADHLDSTQAAVEQDFQLVDFELQRQTREGGAEWSDWEEVDVRTARDVVTECAGIDADVVPVGATDAVITMPLPMRASGVWDYRQVSHPVLQDRQPSPAEIARQVAVCRQLLKDVMERDGSIRETAGMEEAGFSDMIFDTRELVNQLAEDVDLNLDFDQLLFRYLDFDVSPGTEYRYRVRVKSGTNQANVYWTDWSDPTDPVVVALGQPATGTPTSLRDPRRRRNWRELIKKSIVRLVVDVDGDVRTGSGVVTPTGEIAREREMQSLVTAAHLLEDFDSARHTLDLQFYGESEPRRWKPAFIEIDEETGLAMMCFDDPGLDIRGMPFGVWRPLPAIDETVTFHFWTDDEGLKSREERVVAVNSSATPSTLECDGLPENGTAGGGLFNDRGQLVGICVAADLDERRTVFASTPAILEFLRVDEESLTQPRGATNPYAQPVTGAPIGLPGPPHIPLGGPGPGVLNPAGVPDHPKEIQVGMSFDEVIAARGNHYRPTPGMGVGQLFLIYDDITVGVENYQIGEGGGRVFRIDSTARDVDSLVDTTPYADDDAEDPQESGPSPFETPAQPDAPQTNGADTRNVILIALDADDVGSMGEIHVMTESLGTGDEAIERLKRHWLEKVTKSFPESFDGLEVQITVDPLLQYGDAAKVTVFLTEHSDNVRILVRSLDDFQLNVGFVRDAEGRKLSKTPVVFWDDEVHSAGNLSTILEQERRRLPGADATLVIRADNDVPAEIIPMVIRQAQDAGFERVALRVLEADVEQPVLNGVIMDFDSDTQRGRVSIGSEDGLRPQDQLDVYHGESAEERERIGRIEIIRVLPDEAFFRALQTQADDPISSGDQVFGPLTTIDAFRNPSRIIGGGAWQAGPVVELRVQQPTGLKLQWTDPVSEWTEVLVAPCRLNVTPGLLSLQLTDIPGRAGLELRSSVEIREPDAVTRPYLEHNAIPIQFTDEDFTQVESGNYVVKVLYLPSSAFQDLPVSSVETVVSTRLDPSLDPVKEAERRGTILAVVRLGNRTDASGDSMP